MNTTFRITYGTKQNMDCIDHIRHEVYANELGQFNCSTEKTLHDRPEVESTYIVACEDDKVVGFVGITSPDSPAYSIDYYIDRSISGIDYSENLFEIRALTVIDDSRGTAVAPALMYAAYRWVQEHGGTMLLAIGHRKVREMYRRLGMRSTGQSFQCGSLEYEPMAASVESVGTELTRFESRLKRLERQVDWQLDISFRPTTECYHGGTFFEAIGNTFEDIAKRNEIINADVLDAWFHPCPEAQQALHEHLGWLMRTSPPNHAEGLIETISSTRGVHTENILPGGGSSPLIFLALTQWLKPTSRVLILNPMYGEYAHVLEKVVGCHVERFKLHREDGYQIDTQRLSEKLSEGFDLLVWVNPNSPTGRHVKRDKVERVLCNCPSSTRVWIDETYVEYAGAGQSLESHAAQSSNVVVVKSMSKVYGLSGLRVGYLCGPANLLDPLRKLTPPWTVSLPAQVAAVKALQNPDYYREKYELTKKLRSSLVQGLRALGISEVVPGIGNFILFHLPDSMPTGDPLIQSCRAKGLFIRDASEMGKGMGDRAIRIAVKDEATNQRMLNILAEAISKHVTQEVVHHD